MAMRIISKCELDDCQRTCSTKNTGEFLPSMEPVDRFLLERLAQPPRVAIVPTASAPDGDGVPQRWATLGISHFARLGGETEAVMLLTREDASQPSIVSQLARANVVYFSGGKPRYLLETLAGTPAWQMLEQRVRQGATIAGCSAGAMVLGAALFDFPQVWHTLPALGLVPGIAVIPHFNEIPPAFTSTIARMSRKITVVGMDGTTALVGSNGQRVDQGQGGGAVVTT